MTGTALGTLIAIVVAILTGVGIYFAAKTNSRETALAQAKATAAAVQTAVDQERAVAAVRAEGQAQTIREQRELLKSQSETIRDRDRRIEELEDERWGRR